MEMLQTEAYFIVKLPYLSVFDTFRVIKNRNQKSKDMPILQY
jgi:hypothetical protein